MAAACVARPGAVAVDYNGQHACVLVFLPMMDIYTLSICFLYLMNFVFHTTLDAVNRGPNILGVH